MLATLAISALPALHRASLLSIARNSSNSCIVRSLFLIAALISFPQLTAPTTGAFIRKTEVWPLKPPGDPGSSRVMNERTHSVECSGASRSSDSYVEITWDTPAICLTKLEVIGKLLLSMYLDLMAPKAYTNPNGWSRSLSAFLPDDTGVAAHILVPAVRTCHVYFDAPIATITRGFVSRNSPYCDVCIIIL